MFVDLHSATGKKERVMIPLLSRSVRKFRGGRGSDSLKCFDFKKSHGCRAGMARTAVWRTRTRLRECRSLPRLMTDQPGSFFIPCFCRVYHATKVKKDLRVGVTCSSGMRQESVGLRWLYFRPGLN